VKRVGFTHVELMPVTEHPFYGSWGYETTGYFAATGRYGEPEDLMALIDALHQADVGVILDWVPAHFPTDEYALVYFDGAPLYEHADPRRGFHPEWHTSIFDYGRQEVRSFLLSSAMFWLDRFHADGLRVDGVASMLYLDYGRKPGEWLPNERGGHENLEAVELLQNLNDAIHRERAETVTIAEESTAWPRVTGPREGGGLGFDFKWDLGWMHDTLDYLAQDPLYRRWHHHNLTMRGLYAWNEAFVLPLSHDEVVHGKRSLIGKMPGDRWQQFANLRLLYAYMWSLPGKKLLFMGGEIAQWREWNHDGSLDWHLVADGELDPSHRQVQLLVGELNRVYRFERALHELDCDPAGFHWIVPNDAERSVLAYERVARNGEVVLVALNFTPVPRENYRIGVPTAGVWEEILNTDAVELGGSGIGNLGGLEATPVRAHGRELSLSLVLPPLGALYLRRRSTPPR
jgi:1,4-alpha-glucan branching enzyme